MGPWDNLNNSYGDKKAVPGSIMDVVHKNLYEKTATKAVSDAVWSYILFRFGLGVLFFFLVMIAIIVKGVIGHGELVKDCLNVTQSEINRDKLIMAPLIAKYGDPEAYQHYSFRNVAYCAEYPHKP